MKIAVRYFASLTDATGCTSEQVEVRAGETARELWQRLLAQHPKLSAKARPAVACDLEYADWDTTLDGVREIAFLPPVSGG